jgi:multidrug resistance efflux pump
VVQVVPRVTGRVTEVPVQPNSPVKKGDVLFRIDPVPFEIQVRAAEANVANLKAKLISAEASTLNLDEQLNVATANKDAMAARVTLARLRVQQFTELAQTGAGNKFDKEQAEADLANLQAQLASLAATEAQVKVQIAAKTPDGEQDQVAQVKAQIAQADAQLADAVWNLEQTVYYAPSNGTIVNLQLRVGAVASQLVMAPVMTFVEDEQWVIALYKQNELRKVAAGNEAEIAMSMYPGRVIKCKVDSIMWATAQGQLPIGGIVPDFGNTPVPPGRMAVRLLLDGKDKGLFLAAGARGQGAIYTEHGKMIHIIRKVIVRVGTKMDWFIFKLH